MTLRRSEGEKEHGKASQIYALLMMLKSVISVRGFVRALNIKLSWIRLSREGMKKWEKKRKTGWMCSGWSDVEWGAGSDPPNLSFSQSSTSLFSEFQHESFKWSSSKTRWRKVLNNIKDWRRKGSLQCLSTRPHSPFPPALSAQTTISKGNRLYFPCQLFYPLPCHW